MVHTRHRGCQPFRLLTALSAAVVLIAACGATHARLVRGGDVAAAVRGFPTFPGAVWEGDVTAQETDGQLIWIVSWTAPSEEATVSRFFASILGRSGWRFARGHTSHELALRRNEPELRGYLRYGKAEFREAGTSVTLGVRDPRPREKGCLNALPWLPRYPGAEVRSCDLVHIPSSQSLSILMATSDDFGIAWQILGNAFISAGWTSGPGIPGGLEFRHEGGGRETARVIWGPDPNGPLPTGFMISIDLPKAALSELPP